MPSLREIVAAHAPLLILDAASARVQVGVWRRDGTTDWRASEEEAGIGVFRGVEQLDVRLDEIGAFAFCDGPGSILGVRTVAMALRIWQVLKPRPVFAYASLALVAQALHRREIGVIADARRDSWHHFRLGGSLQRIASGALTGELVMPEHFRHWSAPPAGVTRVPYAIGDLLPSVANADLFRACDSPDAFLHEEPSYVTWTPQVHRAP